MKRIVLLILMIFFNSSHANEFKLSNINPSDLVRKGFILHSVTPMEDESSRTMLYTFTNPSTKKIVSCVVELFDISADLHICYDVTQ